MMCINLLMILLVFMITTGTIPINCMAQVNRTLEMHLRRNRRFFFFPKSSTVSVGMSMAKRISPPSPRTTNLLIGTGAAYDLPTSLKDWKPKFIRHKFKTTTTQNATTKYHVIPPYDKRHQLHNHHDILITHSKPVVARLKERVYQKPWSIRPTYKDMLMHIPVKSHFAAKQQKDVNKVNSQTVPQTLQHIQPIPLQNMRPDTNIYRDRREVLQSFEKIALNFGVDIKSGILRTVCEATQFLLPPGKSLIQDIIRILLEAPEEEASIFKGLNCKELLQNFAKPDAYLGK